MYFCRFSELDAATYVGHRRLLCREALVHMEDMILSLKVTGHSKKKKKSPISTRLFLVYNMFL